MQLYILAPIFVFIILKFKNYTNHIFIILIIYGLLVRIISYLYNINFHIIYSSFFGNIDTFLCGICINFINLKFNINKLYLYISIFILICINMILYFIGTHQSMFIYQYILPSIYIILFSLLIYNITTTCNLNYNKKYKLPFKYINKISHISLGIYLWHSNIFFSISKAMPMNLSFFEALGWLVLSVLISIFIGFLYEKTINSFHIYE